jgi:hypothetical protein
MSQRSTDAPTDTAAHEGAESASDRVQQGVRDVAGQAAEQARTTAGRTSERIRSEVDRRSTQGGERLGGVAGDVRSVGDELRAKGKDAPARVADEAAARIDRLGGYLREGDSDRFLNDVEGLGRRRPLVVVAGGVVLGVAAARLLKASSAQRYRGRAAAAGERS